MLSIYRLLRVVWILQVIWNGALLAVARLDDAIIEKDLYKILGVRSNASVKEIQRAFRKLAQKHHPDKAKADNVKHQEWVFRGIAEAYEVLSSQAQRQEYDQRRSHLQRTLPEANTRRSTNYQAFASSFDVFTSEYQDRDVKQRSFPQYHLDFQPVVTGPILRANQIMIPYDPILATVGHTTFALLDETCAIVVYQGDLDAFIRNTLLYGQGTGLHSTSTEFDVLYRTPPFPKLQGLCSAGLDESGVLHVFRGKPSLHRGMNSQYSIWSSTDNNDIMHHLSWPCQLQLQPTGMLEIRTKLNQCVWMSTSSSCNEMESAIRMATSRTRIALSRSFSVSNVISLPRRVLNSRLVARITTGIVHILNAFSTQWRKLRCYAQHALDKYIIQAQDVDGNTLNECIRMARSVHSKSRSGRSKNSGTD